MSVEGDVSAASPQTNNRSTGYGPPTSTSARWHKLQFDGDADKYELWEAKFLGHMSLLNLKTAILPPATGEAEDAVKNERCYSELIQFLDDVSLSLVMREAADNGRKAFKILREHYAGKGESRLLSIYSELTSLQKSSSETITDFILRAEKSATALRNTGESFSDGLLICVILKGLPDEYKPFSVVITQREERDFATFKVSLRNFEETEKLRGGGGGDSLNLSRGYNNGGGKGGGNRGGQQGGHGGGRSQGGGGGAKKKGPCFNCGGMGHQQQECSSPKQSKWRGLCKNNSHFESNCRKKNKNNNGGGGKTNNNNNNNNDGARRADEKSHSFQFVMIDHPETPAEESVEVPDVETEHDAEDGVEVSKVAGVTFVNSMLVDSGATSHIVHDESMFTSFDDDFKPRKHCVELADGRKLSGMALKKGKVPVGFKDSTGTMRESVLNGALFIPTFPSDLFSVNGAVEQNPNTVVTFGSKQAVMKTEDGTEFVMPKRGKLWFIDSYIPSKVQPVTTKAVVDNPPSDPVPTPAKKRSDTLETWHRIMGHCNKHDVLRLEGVVEGMKITTKTLDQCESCILGKETQTRNREPDERAKSPMEFVHTDLAGPVAPVGRGGYEYVLSFIDDFSGAMFVYFLKLKSEAVRGLRKFLADSNSYGKIERMRSDGGGEFIPKEFEQVCIDNKIKIEGSAPYSPHQNGTAERGFRTQFEMARCLLAESKLPKQLWPYALMASVYIRNRCYSQRTQQTPYFLLTGKKPNISHMHIFGTFCYPYQVKKTKLDDRCKKGIFLGYDGRSLAYIVYYPECNKILNHRCVTFTDSHVDIGTRKEAVNVQPKVPMYFGDDDDFDYPTHADNPPAQPAVANGDETEVVDIDDDDVVPEPVVDVDAPGAAGGTDGGATRYPTRDRRPPGRFDEYVVNENDDDFEDRVNYRQQ